MARTKIAFFDLTGCEGCEFHLLSLNELLLDVFQDFEITNWRLLSETEKSDFDIAFVEGAATTSDHIDLLKQIRKTSKIVVAIGACAISGNIFKEINSDLRKKLAPKIYDQNYQLKAKFLEPIEKFITVDEKIPGCPPDIEKFKELLKKIKKQKVTSRIKKVGLPEYVAKIEGHGSLKINFRMKQAEFEVEESERLIEGLLVGKSYQQAPFINSRICGICPIAHNLCSWKAIENAFGVNPSKESIALRKIMLAAQIIKSHLLHLFFLVLPDFAQTKSSIKLARKYPAEFHLMLNIKRVAEKALEVVAGSITFPTNTTLGGFINPPKVDNLMSVKNMIYDVIDESSDLINLFSQLKSFKIQSEVEFLSTDPVEGQYPLYETKTTPLIWEIVQRSSSAKLGILPNGQVVKVGALARMAKFSNRLNPLANNAYHKFSFEFNNPFNNNLAQAIEILHYLEEMERLIESLQNSDLEKAKGRETTVNLVEEINGEACLEAPRGVLVHQVKIGRDEKILNYNIIVPTQINLASLENDTKVLLREKSKASEETIKKEVGKLIRAFDPCITCAVH